MFVRKRYKSYLFKNCQFGTTDNDDVGFDGSVLTVKMEYSDYEHNWVCRKICLGAEQERWFRWEVETSRLSEKVFGDVREKEK